MEAFENTLSVYTNAFEKISTKSQLDVIDVVTMFYFLVSHKDNPNDKIQKEILNIHLNSLPSFTELEIKHYPIHMAPSIDMAIIQCKSLDSQLTLRTVLTNLNKSISSPNTDSFCRFQSLSNEFFIHSHIHPENHIGFSFKGTLRGIGDFTLKCLELLSSVETRLIELSRFANEINDNYSSELYGGYCRVSDFYVNDKWEDILIINEYHVNIKSDYIRDEYIHISKESLLKYFESNETKTMLLSDVFKNCPRASKGVHGNSRILVCE